MARICSVLACSHSPFLFQPVEWWNRTRDSRPPSLDAVHDDDAANAAKKARCDAAFAELARVFRESKPDVLVVFGDDQEEQFSLRNFPAFAIYTGGSFGGYREVAYEGVPGSRQLKAKTSEHWTTVATRPALAQSLLGGLLAAGFDPAFMTALPNEDFGLGHAFMRPAGKLTQGRFDVPMVPVLVNCFYAPQPSAARCVAAARAIRQAIETWPENLDVAVLGSGGLWHTPGAQDSYIDAEFDGTILEGIRSGDVDGMASYFDRWKPRPEYAERRCYASFSGGTGMPGGIGTGVGETRNWLMAAAVAGTAGVVIDYVPVYASPCGMGFAYWKL